MPLVVMPNALKIRSIEWSQAQAFQTQRSVFTGHTRYAEIGTAHRWAASVTFVSMNTGDARIFRAWMARFLRPGNHTHLEIDAEAQSNLVNTIVQSGVNAFASLIPFSGAPASTLIVPAGGFISLPLVGDDVQAATLVADAVSNSSGAGTFEIAQQLRRSTVAGAAVEYRRPFAQMLPLDPVRWTIEPVPLYSSAVVQFEEAF